MNSPSKSLVMKTVPSTSIIRLFSSETKVISSSSLSKSLEISATALAGTTSLKSDVEFLSFFFATARRNPSKATQVSSLSLTEKSSPFKIGLLSSVEQENTVLFIMSLKSF